MGQSVYGAIKLASDGYDSYSPTSDYLLLELNTSAATLKSYGVVYAGWEANESKAINSSYTVGIHHPSGDVKKISMDAHPPVSVNSPFSGALSTHWQVSWDMGITEGGSSGSPLFNSDHKIIGQLHGGNSYCQTPQAPDFYGKFSKSFTNGNLSFWLDPYFSGATSIGTYNPSQINENCYNGIKDGNETGVDCGGNCPPCGWTSPIGGGSVSHCNNGVQDEGETGIDCGGTCKPCGGAAQCSNCKKDGDETGVDCGGSCPPCNNNCTDKMDVVYSNTNNLPYSTVAQNSITTNVNVNILPKQSVTFKAGSAIVLNNGFSASEGSTFSAFIAPCDCKLPCAVLYPNVFTPNGDGVNDWLVYTVSGYNRFEVKVFNNWSNLIYSSSGTISGNYAYVWNGSSSASGNAYLVETTLYSDCLGISKLISHMVNVLKSAGNNSEEYSEEILTDINLNNMPEEINIYPNPANEFITIKYPYRDNPIIYMVNESGKIVYLKKDVDINSGSLNINVKNFVSGVYIIKIVHSGEIFVKKFIKK